MDMIKIPYLYINNGLSWLYDESIVGCKIIVHTFGAKMQFQINDKV